MGELLPCPFCGGAPFATDQDYQDEWCVRCAQCGGRSGIFRTREQAITAWNKHESAPHGWQPIAELKHKREVIVGRTDPDGSEWMSIAIRWGIGFGILTADKSLRFLGYEPTHFRECPPPAPPHTPKGEPT